MRRLVRWRGAIVAALLSAVLGIGLGSSALFLLGAVALGIVAFGYLGAEPNGQLRVERDLSSDDPSPGVPVTVSLTIHNESDSVQPDIRVVDDPPDDVAITSGVPAVATSLRAGESVTHKYDISPPRGDHEFGTPTLRRRNLASTLSETMTTDVDGVAEFTCETLLDSFPLREQTIQYVGRSPTDDGGSGIEFYATRQYRPGDPINRIDWHRLAKTGELATVEYREERAVTVVFVVDDRDGIHYSRPGGGPDSFDLTLYAASKGIVASITDGNPTGVTTLDHDRWVEPGTSEGTQRRTDDLLERIEDGPPNAVADGGPRGETPGIQRISERLPRNAQVVFCTPLTDDGVIEAVRQLVGRDHDVTVLSPDITTDIDSTDPTVGVEAEVAWRSLRVSRLRSIDVPVIDWSLDEPIPVELQRLLRRTGNNV